MQVTAAIVSATGSAMITPGVVWTLTVFFPTIPVRMFTSNPELIGLTAQTMRVFFLGAGHRSDRIRNRLRDDNAPDRGWQQLGQEEDQRDQQDQLQLRLG